jgi:hypothetical protein
VIYVSRNHCTNVIDKLAAAKEGLVAAHTGVVKEEKAPFSGLEARRCIQGGFNIIFPELRDQEISA